VSVKELMDTSKGIAVFTAEFILKFEQLCVLKQEIPEATIKVMLKKQIKNPAFSQALNYYATSFPSDDFTFDEDLLPQDATPAAKAKALIQQKYKHATRSSSPWRLFLAVCCEIVTEFPDRDITSATTASLVNSATTKKKKKSNTSIANAVRVASESSFNPGPGKPGQVFCPKCAQWVPPGQEGRNCTSATCARCNEKLTIKKYHTCPNFDKGNQKSGLNPTAAKSPRTERDRSRSRSRNKDSRKDRDRTDRDRYRDDKSGDRRTRQVYFTEERSPSRDRNSDHDYDRSRRDDRRDDNRDPDKRRSYYGPSSDDRDERDERDDRDNRGRRRN
jgi:hypothetical protein